MSHRDMSVYSKRRNPLRDMGRFEFFLFSLVDTFLPWLTAYFWSKYSDVTLDERIEETERRLDELEREDVW